jgi:Peptidase family M1 domain
MTGLRAQHAGSDTALYGEYRANAVGQLFVFQIYPKDGKLMVQIVGQGVTTLTALSPLTFRPEHVRPVATMKFLKDSLGQIDRFEWVQETRGIKWTRIGGPPTGYLGDYRNANNPYSVLHIWDDGGRLKARTGDAADSILTPIDKDHFVVRKKGVDLHLAFIRDRDQNKLITGLTTNGIDRITFARTARKLDDLGRQYGFTRADTLQGRLTPLRTCYDVLFYDLDLTVLPELKAVRGSNTIRFRVVRDFNRFQVDLHANLTIDKVLYHDRELAYAREYNAVYVDFPATLKEGGTDSLKIIYHGKPLEPDLVHLRGGVFWLWDRDKQFWIESVTQGVGANVLWPCKDHLSDRPDSMRISVTIPTGLTDISNGRLLERTALPDNMTRWVWYVDYPMPNYDVCINIGNYVHFSDDYIEGGDTLKLNYYTMPYSEQDGRRLFVDVKRMLALYQREFGPYPFPRDGFTLLEGIYPMEHQGAISVGMINSPYNNEKADAADLHRTMWHESAHQWWGNSVGCSDNADIWIHESFADYAEFLNDEDRIGHEAAVKRLISGHPDNKEPIIGVYNVNHFHLGDVYLKGSLLLETLRNVIANDSIWFGIFRGIQAHFRYQTATTEDIVGYFNSATGKDYTYFFDQYLRHAAIPKLVYHLEQKGPDLELKYKWEADVAGFRMPIKVTMARDSLAFIYPTTDWQMRELKGVTPPDFRVDTAEFYVDVKMD